MLKGKIEHRDRDGIGTAKAFLFSTTEFCFSFHYLLGIIWDEKREGEEIINRVDDLEGNSPNRGGQRISLELSQFRVVKNKAETEVERERKERS